MNMIKSAAAVAVLTLFAAAPAAVHAAEGTAISWNNAVYYEDVEGYRIVISEPGRYYLSEDIIKSDTAFAIRNEANGEVTLDLNGKTITNGGEWTAIWNLEGCTMTIIDSVGGGSVNSNYDAINNAGTLTVNGGSYSGTWGGASNNGTLTINGGSFTGGEEAVYQAGTLTITDGSFTGGFGGTICLNDKTTSQKVTINGGDFTADANDTTFGIFNTTTAAQNADIDLDINGGTFNNAVIIWDGEPRDFNVDLDITGGTFNSGLAVKQLSGNTSPINITGGTFKATSSAYAEVDNTKGAIVVDDFAEVNIGGNVRVEASGDGICAVGLDVAESGADDTPIINITGGTFISDDESSMEKVDDFLYGTVNYTVYNNQSSLNKKNIHRINITGGTFNGGGFYGVTAGGDAVCTPGADDGYFKITRCVINGGTFDKAAVCGGAYGDDWVKISGGTFTNFDTKYKYGYWSIIGGVFDENIMNYYRNEKYIVPEGYYAQVEDGVYTVKEKSEDVTEGTVISSINSDGTYDRMEIVTDTFDYAAEGVTYKVTFTGGDYDGQTKTVSHDFGTTITGSVIYGLIIEGIPSDVTAVITVE